MIWTRVTSRIINEIDEMVDNNLSSNASSRKSSPGSAYIVEYACDKYWMYSFTFPLSRQAWALVSEVGGGNASCSEDVREHENHDTGGRALASRNFTTMDGVGFSVTAYSEWKNGEKYLKIAFVSK